MPVVAARTSPLAMTRPDDPDLPIARLRDLVAPARLLLAGFGFWTAFALVFAIEYWLLAIPEPFPRIVAGQLASWWPCALLTPPVAAAHAPDPRPCGSRAARALLLHAGGAAAFVIVGGALMGACREPAPLVASRRRPARRGAAWGMLRYIGPDLLLYCARGRRRPRPAAHAWESRQRAIAAATYARQLAEARLHVLSAQLQPHFLFNTLHAISALDLGGPGPRRPAARAAERDAAAHAPERHPGRDHARGGAGPARALRRDPGGPLRRPAQGPYRRRARERGGAGAAAHPAAAGRERHPPRHHPADHAGTGGRRARVAGRGPPAPRPCGTTASASTRRPVREGVGLAITRARLRQLYGPAQRFELAPAPGAARSARSPSRSAPRRERPRDRARIRALIVDDEPLARARLRGLLARHADMQLVGRVRRGRRRDREAIAADASRGGVPRHPDDGDQRARRGRRAR